MSKSKKAVQKKSSLNEGNWIVRLLEFLSEFYVHQTS